MSTNYIFTSIWFAAALIYLLPTLIAFYRHANSVWPIAVLNLLLGWTLLGGVAALVWSLTAIKDVPMHRAAVCPACLTPMHPDARICPHCRTPLGGPDPHKPVYGQRLP